MIQRPYDWLVRLHPRQPTTYASRSRTVLATSPDGFIFENKEHGLWVYQTRTLCRYRWLVNGSPPTLSAASNLQQHTWMGYYITNPPNVEETGLDEKDPAQQTVELRLSRYVGEGMHEDVGVTNYTQIRTPVVLELEVDADFADPSEAGGERKQKGELRRDWRKNAEGLWELEFDYQAKHKYSHQGDKGEARIHCGIKLTIDHCDSEPKEEEGRIRFQFELEPHASWHACLNWVARIEDHWLPLKHDCPSSSGTSEWDEWREKFLSESTGFDTRESSTLAPVVIGALEQAKRDIAALRLHDLDRAPDIWTMAAGFPTYDALFGRDSLAASWEADLLSLQMTRGTLLEQAKCQGIKIDDWLDEQPGRIVHELHTNPLAALKFSPHGQYYGGVTGAIYYPVVVAGLWHWTGDREFVRSLIDTAMAGLEWADNYADLDGDGFYEYKTRSTQGEKNQGWKDSGDAIVYEDGSQVEAPIGTCEMQAFVYASKLHFSEVLWWMGEKDLAKRLYREASELKKRFNEAFWMEDEGYFAMGLDKDKRQIKSVGSDPGHCLISGIVDKALIPRVVTRMMAEDMFSGWGIRTLSAKHPAFNPYSYHRGTVWPVENAVFALAFARYGVHAHMHALSKAQFEAAAIFDYYRLPELFSGHQRNEQHPFPAMYPRANWPQAWSASAVFTQVQALVGLYPYAPLHVLMVDPHLPVWLPEITLRNIRVGKATVDIRFYRKQDGNSDYEVLGKRGRLNVVRQPSPWSLTAEFGERVRDAIESLLPGK